MVLGITGVAFGFQVLLKKFLPKRRYAPLLGLHLLILFGFLVTGIAWDKEVIEIYPTLLLGPLNFVLPRSHSAFPFYVEMSEAWTLLVVTGPLVLLQAASLIRTHWSFLLLSSAGACLWFLAGIGGLLSQIG